METNNNVSKLNKGIIILIIVLIIAVLGLGGYFVYNKVINKNDNTSNANKTNNNVNEINNNEVNNNTQNAKAELKSIVYTTCEQGKIITDAATMKKVTDVINAKISVEQEGLVGTCATTLALDYGTNIVTVKIVGNDLISIDDQVYKITAPDSSDPSSYITSLFK